VFSPWLGRGKWSIMAAFLSFVAFEVVGNKGGD